MFSSCCSQLCPYLAGCWPGDSSPQLWADSAWTQEVLPVVVVVTRVPGGMLMLCKVVLISAWVSVPGATQGQAPWDWPVLGVQGNGGELGFASDSLVMGDAGLL